MFTFFMVKSASLDGGNDGVSSSGALLLLLLTGLAEEGMLPLPVNVLPAAGGTVEIVDALALAGATNSTMHAHSR